MAVWVLVQGVIFDFTGELALLSIEIGFNIIALVYTIDLIRFHYWLQKNSLTTYEWVVFNRLRKSMYQEVKDGVTEPEEFQYWVDHYFDGKKKVTSKIIVQKKQDDDSKETENDAQLNSPTSDKA